MKAGWPREYHTGIEFDFPGAAQAIVSMGHVQINIASERNSISPPIVCRINLQERKIGG